MKANLKKALGLNRPRLTLSILFGAIGIAFAFPPYVVATGSMAPTMPPGSFVITCRSVLLPMPIGKNDLAVFKPVKGISTAPWIHRIVADSGEEITPPVRKGRVDVSPEAIAQPGDESTKSFVVPKGFFYQSGDSSSSYHGLIPQEVVIGRVLFHFKLPWR
jgi:signal peptidase I